MPGAYIPRHVPTRFISNTWGAEKRDTPCHPGVWVIQARIVGPPVGSARGELGDPSQPLDPASELRLVVEGESETEVAT